MRKLARIIIPNRYKPYIKQKFNVWHYRGHQVCCPCCQGRFRSFMPGGVIKRPDARCPQCHALERHRLLWLYFADKTNLFSDDITLLHFAPEPSIQSLFQALPNINYYSVDLMSPLAQTHMDITHLAYKDNSFDVILCSHVLEHILDDSAAMHELLRILKPGGWAILQTPIDKTLTKTFEDETVVTPEERRRVFHQHDHVRIYGCDYKDRLQESGFKVLVDDYVGQLKEETIWYYGLDANEDIYFCTKPETARENKS